MYLSHRSQVATATNPLTRALAERRAASLPVFDLTASNPTNVDLAWPAEALAAALSSPANTGYQPHPFGLPSAREAVAATLPVPPGFDPKRHGGLLSADRVVLTASTSEAYALLFKALCDPGDEVLALTPSYPLFEQLAALEGVRLTHCPLAWDGAWHLDPEAVRRALSPRTRAILLVNPNNPTGHYLREADLEALSRFTFDTRDPEPPHTRVIPIIVDEVFQPYPHRGPRWSALQRPDVFSIVLDGLSKRAGLPQIKAGWMVVNGPRVLAHPLMARLEHIADAYLSLSTPTQHALPALLADAPGVGQAIHQRTINNLKYLHAASAGTPIEIHPVEGGWYAVAALPHVMDDEAWALRLLAAGVLVQPGYFYDFAQPARVVISLLTPPDVFAEGVEILVAAASAP